MSSYFISTSPVPSLHNPLDARKQEAEDLKRQSFASPSILSQIRRACLRTAWFSFPTSADGSSSVPSASSQIPDSTRMSDGAAPALGTESTAQPVVKTAYEYAIKRLDCLSKVNLLSVLRTLDHCCSHRSIFI